MGSKEELMEVERDAEDPVGALLDPGLRVVKVTPGTLADGHLIPGDRIISVNGATLATRDDYYYKLRFAQPRLRLVYRRPKTDGEEEKDAEPPKKDKSVDPELPPELEDIIRRRPGFQYLAFDFDLPAEPTKGLGIALTNVNHRVIVTGLKKGSLGAEKLARLDRFLAINAVSVSDKQVASALVAKSGGKFTVLVERPDTPGTKKEHEPKAAPINTASASGASFADVGGDTRILPADCLLITKKEREKAKLAAGPGILYPPAPTLRTESTTNITGGHDVTEIARDTPDDKRLKTVGPR